MDALVTTETTLVFRGTRFRQPPSVVSDESATSYHSDVTFTRALGALARRPKATDSQFVEPGQIEATVESPQTDMAVLPERAVLSRPVEADRATTAMAALAPATP